MELQAALAALALAEKLFPLIQEKLKSGEVTVEEQQQLRDRYNSLRNAGAAAFEGSEWQIG